ncbi:TrkH family potassium uptake protein [Paramylibacter ulvae]|nr:TrkH family potassium uptake protein [Amylibacter ulvae]
MIALRNQPLFVVMMAITAASMMVPVLFAARLEQWLFARTFLYHSIVLMLITALMAIAMSNRDLSNRSANRLMDILAGFILMPFFMAMPLSFLMPQIGFFAAYFEMVSSFTTTGASVFMPNQAVPDVIHLWRALVAWMGGFLMLVVAIAIFKPVNLGGFEVYTSSKDGVLLNQTIKRAALRDRLIRYSAVIFPLYTLLTAVLALLLILSGDRMLVAVIHAMSTLSTSGISPVGGLSGSAAGYIGEVFIFGFFIYGITRHLFFVDRNESAIKLVKRDKELNMALYLVVIIPAVLFFRHWLAASEVNQGNEFYHAISALWGSMFTVLSFLTTTGFESNGWTAARDWSGLGTTGLILMAVAVMGGGIATTAGGVKLLRVYALYKHGLREMQRLSYPHSVGGSGSRARNIRREGAYAAWIFFMLFLVSIAVGMLCLSLMGINFEDSLILSISALSNTGPLLAAASDNGVTYGAISSAGKGILCALMILGRLEALAVIAILNPNYWRK